MDPDTSNATKEKPSTGTTTTTIMDPSRSVSVAEVMNGIVAKQEFRKAK
jgi:hypothetical protein